MNDEGEQVFLEAQIMESSFFSKSSLANLYDDVLERCMIEFRQALGMLERNGMHLSNPYTVEMKQSLELMEAELARRNRGRAPSAGESPEM